MWRAKDGQAACDSDLLVEQRLATGREQVEVCKADGETGQTVVGDVGQVAQDRADFSGRCRRRNNRGRRRLVQHGIKHVVIDGGSAERQVQDAAAADVVHIVSHGFNLTIICTSCIDVHRQTIGKLGPEGFELNRSEGQFGVAKNAGDTEILDTGRIVSERAEVARVHCGNVNAGSPRHSETEQRGYIRHSKRTRNAQVGNLVNRKTIDTIRRARRCQQAFIASKSSKLNWRCASRIDHANRHIGCASICGIEDLQDIGN